MYYPITAFAQALDADLRAAKMDQQELCAMLIDPNEDVPLTGAAISNWKRRGRPPARRMERLVEIFGASSHIAALARTGGAALVAPETQAAPQAAPQMGLMAYARPSPSVPPVARRGSSIDETLRVTLPPGDRRVELLDGGVQIAGRTYRFDYLSDTLALEIVECSRPDLLKVAFTRSMLRLALLHAHEGRDYANRKLCLLILVPPEAVSHRHMQQVTSECALLGIRSVILTDRERVWDEIGRLEREKEERPEDDFD